MASSSGRRSRYSSTLDRVRWHRVALVRADREELALVVPFVNGRVGVETLVALQADEPRPQHLGQRFADFGLADPGFSFDQQRPPEPDHQTKRHCLVRDIADIGEVALQRRVVERHLGSARCALRDGASRLLRMR
jgi:hypothetical protein